MLYGSYNYIFERVHHTRGGRRDTIRRPTSIPCGEIFSPVVYVNHIILIYYVYVYVCV